MLRPSRSQPGCNFQKSHSLLKTTPIPQEDDASTQNSIGEMGGGFDREEPQNGRESWARHHAILVMMLGLGVLEMKGEVE